MSKKLLSFCLVLFFYHISFAQNKSTIQGTILDSLTKAPKELATVAISSAENSALIAYSTTDKNGKFSLTALPDKKALKLIVSYVGYDTYRLIIDTLAGSKRDLGNLLLNSSSLKEINITAERSPVTIKRDTIEFSAEAFKTRPNAVIEDLLKKLPGVQINIDGTILVNGKHVSKLLIDGKQFFGNDPKIATRNMDANIIDKIQVYDDRENDPDEQINISKVNKIINLKLKKEVKKSILGKIYGGIGTRERFESGAILSSFRDTLQISVIGLANNLTKTGFSRQDLNSFGGFDRSSGEKTYDGTFGGRSGQGIEQIASSGFNINNDFGDKLKLNLMYFYSYSNRKIQTQRLQQQFLPETIVEGLSTNERKDINHKHDISALLEWKPNKTTKIKYEPKLTIKNGSLNTTNITDASNSQEPKLYNNNSTQNAKNSSPAFSHNITYYHKFSSNNQSLNITQQLNLNQTRLENYLLNNLQSFSSNVASEKIDRFKDNHSKYNTANINANYNISFSKKLFAEVNLGENYLKMDEGLYTYDKNPLNGQYDLKLIDQSNKGIRTQLTSNLKPTIGYKINDIYTLKIGVNGQIQDVKNKYEGLTQNTGYQFINLFPTLRFDGSGFSVEYGERLEQPSLADQQPLIKEFSAISQTVGNPDLKPKHQRSVYFNYYKYINKKSIGLNGYGGFGRYENNIIDKITVDNFGKMSTTKINKGNGLTANIGMGFSKDFKKSEDWQISSSTQLDGSANKNKFILNKDEGSISTYDIGLAEDITYTYKDQLQINGGYRFGNSITTYQNVDYSTIRSLNHAIKTSISFSGFKRIDFETDYTFNYNPQLPQGFQKRAHILNMSLAHQLLQHDQGQLKLSVYDLFNQNSSVFRIAQDNVISSGEQLVMKRYFLLTYQYKFKIIKKK